jgi:hypothetical protein
MDLGGDTYETLFFSDSQSNEGGAFSFRRFSTPALSQADC